MPFTQPKPPAATYLGNKLALTRILDRYKMYVDTSDEVISPHLLLDGFWEMWITKVFTDLVKPGMTVLDVGANFGYYTLIASDRVGPNGKVHAIEADPYNAELLRRTVTVNGFDDRTIVHQVAAYNTRKTLKLFQVKQRLANNRLYVPDPDSPKYHTVTVDALPLDEIIEGTVDLVKIDTENSEPFVIEGMMGLCENNPQIKIIMEFSPYGLRLQRTDPAGFLRRLRELGFSLALLTEHSTIEPFEEQKVADGPLVTLFLSRS